MPIVLTENEATESGITYEDKTGISYEYPPMYRKLIQPGERFVYYRGRKRKSGGRHPQVYFGSGVVGEILTPASGALRLTCRILDYRPFLTPIPFKSGKGYLETEGSRRGYYQRGARRISEAEFDAILEAAEVVEESELATRPLPAAGPVIPREVLGRPAYASPETLRLIEDFAVKAAVNEIERRYPGAAIRVLPRNNPGFDIEVSTSNAVLYVEVKGTGRAAVQFFATEGELEFSRRNASHYRLIVVYRINLTQGSFKVHWSEGAISHDAGFSLQPVQWACEVIDPAARSSR